MSIYALVFSCMLLAISHIRTMDPLENIIIDMAVQQHSPEEWEALLAYDQPTTIDWCNVPLNSTINTTPIIPTPFFGIEQPKNGAIYATTSSQKKYCCYACLLQLFESHKGNLKITHHQYNNLFMSQTEISKHKKEEHKIQNVRDDFTKKHLLALLKSKTFQTCQECLNFIGTKHYSYYFITHVNEAHIVDNKVQISSKHSTYICFSCYYYELRDKKSDDKIEKKKFESICFKSKFDRINHQKTKDCLEKKGDFDSLYFDPFANLPAIFWCNICSAKSRSPQFFKEHVLQEHVIVKKDHSLC